MVCAALGEIGEGGSPELLDGCVFASEMAWLRSNREDFSVDSEWLVRLESVEEKETELGRRVGMSDEPVGWISGLSTSPLISNALAGSGCGSAGRGGIAGIRKCRMGAEITCRKLDVKWMGRIACV